MTHVNEQEGIFLITSYRGTFWDNQQERHFLISNLILRFERLKFHILKPTRSQDKPFQLTLYVFQNKTLKDASVLWIHGSEPQSLHAAGMGCCRPFWVPPLVSDSPAPRRGPAAPPAGRSAAVRPERPRAPGQGQTRRTCGRTRHYRRTCTSAKTAQHLFLSLTGGALHRPSPSTLLLWAGIPSTSPGYSKPQLTLPWTLPDSGCIKALHI